MHRSADDVAAVYRVACHLEVGDETAAQALTAATLAVAAGESASLIGLAHRLHLEMASRRPDRAKTFVDEQSWSGALEVLRAMPAQQRALLSLVDVEHLTVERAAKIAFVTDAEATAVLDAGRRLLSESGAPLPATAFALTDRWLDDDQRVAMAMLSDATRIDAVRHETTLPRRLRRSRVGALTAAAAALLAATTVWFPTNTVGTKLRSSTMAERANSVSSGDAGMSGLSAVVGLATGLGDEQTVRPSSIVRFTNDRVGVSWSGPCNRPATSIRFANTRNGVELQLTTGSFFVVSCVGMPTRWTATVAIPVGIASGRIVPTMSGADLRTTFTGYSEHTASTETTLHENGSARFGSALVDADNHAWAFLQDCSAIDRIHYPGNVYEIRLGRPGSSCASADRTPRLVGPNGQRFPYLPHRDGGSTGVPADCAGPAGSATDVSTIAIPGPLPGPVSETVLITTWDGCFVLRPGIVTAAHLPATCGWSTALVVSFGDPIGAPITGAGERFIGDPDGVVPGQVAPLLPTIAMPPDSIDTGIRIENQLMFTAQSVPAAVFVVTDHGVQRWPLFATQPYCDGIRA